MFSSQQNQLLILKKVKEKGKKSIQGKRLHVALIIFCTLFFYSHLKKQQLKKYTLMWRGTWTIDDYM